MTESKTIRWTEDINLPQGFQAAGVAAGLKKEGRKDMALIVSEKPAVMAGVFTTASRA